MKISVLLVCLMACCVAVDAVSVINFDHQDVAKNTISEDDRRGVPQSEVDSESYKNKSDKYRRNAANEKQQRYLQPAASSYDSHTSNGGGDTSASAKPDYYPSASGYGALAPLPYSHSSPTTDLKYHHHLPPLHHGTGGGITGYGSNGGDIGHITGYGHAGDLGLGGPTNHYGGPSYGGGGGGGKYPGYGLTKYSGDYGGHGGLFGGGGHGGHNNAHLKGLLLPLVGIALLGAAAALTTNPVLLQLGVVNGKRKRRSIHATAYQSIKRDLDKYQSIEKYIRQDSLH